MLTPAQRREMQCLVHDLNNVFFLVTAHAEAIADTLPTSAPQGASATAIAEAAARGLDVLARLRHFEAPGPEARRQTA